MAAGKENGKETDQGASGTGRSVRNIAEERLARSKETSELVSQQTPEDLIHELQVHQIELEMQAEELRNAHLALKESHDKYLDLYDFAPLGYLTLTDKALIAEANLTSAALLDVGRSTLIKARFSKFIAETDTDKWHRYFMNLVKRGEKLTCTITLTRSDGVTFPARLEAVRIMDGSDQSLSVRVVFSDITDTRRIEDALRVSSKKLNLLSSMTRHDINNQLLVLNGYLGIIQNKISDPAMEKDFTHVTDASSRISRIIRFTKEYDQIGIKSSQWLDCRTLANTASGQITLGKITLKNEIPDGVKVFADPMIEKVFFNLLDNAVRHGGKITGIRLFSEKRDADLILVCEDDGVGIGAGEKELIFDKEYGKNTGLGLFLAREILDISGITLRETGEPGRGARFEMRVPRGAWRVTR